MDDDVDVDDDVDDDDGDNVPGWILKEEDEGCGWIGRRSESKGGWQATLARSHPPHFSPFSSERLFNFPELFVDHPFSSLLQPPSRSSPQPRPPPQLTWLSSWNSKYAWQWRFPKRKKRDRLLDVSPNGFKWNSYLWNCVMINDLLLYFVKFLLVFSCTFWIFFYLMDTNTISILDYQQKYVNLQNPSKSVEAIFVTRYFLREKQHH